MSSTREIADRCNVEIDFNSRRVTLDGSNSNDPDGDFLEFVWTQTTGPTVELTDADTATASFTAPNTSSDMILRFQLDVTDPGGLSDSSDVTVTVTASSPNQPDGGGGGPMSLWMLLGLAGFLINRKDAP